MLGLLACQISQTVKGMILNFAHLIKVIFKQKLKLCKFLFSIWLKLTSDIKFEFQKHGLIPNGGRTYYLCRSQPPLFIQMVDLFIEKTNDTGFLKYLTISNQKKVPGQKYILLLLFKGLPWGYGNRIRLLGQVPLCYLQTRRGKLWNGALPL